MSMVRLNTVAKWFTLLLHICKVEVKILAQRPAILTELSWLSSVPPGRCQDSTLKEAMTASVLFPIDYS
jgi:hypothetical protein